MKPIAGLVLFLGSFSAVPALAAGYGLKESSARAMGAAYAGSAADAGDPAAMIVNPATLSGVTGTDGSLSLVGILAHSAADYSRALTAAGTPPGGSASPRDFIGDAPIPSFALRYRLSDDLAVGLALSAPFGLKTTYPDNWAGRYHARKTEAMTINIAPSLAWQVTPELSLGASLNVQNTRGLLTSAVDIGTLGALNMVPGAIPGAFDGGARFSAFAWDVGFTLGALYSPDDAWTFGVAYKSAIHHVLQGPLKFTLDPVGLGAGLRAMTGLFTDTRASTKLTTPDMLSFGGRYRVTDDFTLLAELDWTNWSRFTDLTIVPRNAAQPNDVTIANWHDAVFASLGGAYRLSGSWTVRGGGGYDETPTPAALRNPRIPDASRVWLAAGVEWRITPGTAVNLSYGRLFNTNGTIALSAAQPGNALRGDLAGLTRSSVDTVGLQVSSSF